MQISEWCSSRALTDVKFREGGSATVDLYKGFQDMFAAFLHVPLTFTAKIASLHSWLYTNVLDISSMILFSFMMYICGVRQCCPLHVIALAVKGEALTDAQMQQYNALCEMLMPVVIFEPQYPDAEYIAASRKNPKRNVRAGLMKPVNKETLDRRSTGHGMTTG